MFNNCYVTRPNALLLMPVQFLCHGLLPNKVTMTHLLKRAEEPVVFTEWKTSVSALLEQKLRPQWNIIQNLERQLWFVLNFGYSVRCLNCEKC
jgi:hypothetical protein